MWKLIALAVCAITLAQDVSSERILCVGLVPSYSHQMFHQPLWRELALRGHDVVVITPDPTNEVLPNFKEISIRESYPIAKQFMDMLINTNMLKLIVQNKWMEVHLTVGKFQLELPAVQQLINNKSEHFDLLMIEHFVSPAFGLQHRFNCPMIGVVSLDAMPVSHDFMGNPTHSILYPLLLANQNNLTFLNRLTSTLLGILVIYQWEASIGAQTEIGRKFFGEDMPEITELIAKTDMLFVNANPVFSAVRPHTPSTISIAGGMHLRKPKPLPKDLKDFLDAAKDGAIYFSLGSNVKSNELALNLRQTIIETLSQIPYKILWKFEDETLPGKPDNVMITKWTPQQDVLRHKNVKLFITQGGLQSLEESLYMHVPVVVMPFFADQESNAEKAKIKGMGLVVDRHNLKIDDFKAAIMEVIENSTYQQTVKKLALQIQDTPRTPLENAVWWTEYVLRHKGAQHLKGPRIPMYQYYYFDVLAFLGAVLLIIFGVLFVVVRSVLRGICSLLKCRKSKTAMKQKVK